MRLSKGGRWSWWWIWVWVVVISRGIGPVESVTQSEQHQRLVVGNYRLLRGCIDGDLVKVEDALNHEADYNARK